MQESVAQSRITYIWSSCSFVGKLHYKSEDAMLGGPLRHVDAHSAKTALTRLRRPKIGYVPLVSSLGIPSRLLS